MVDFTAPNLQGANAAFNNIVSKLNDTKSSALSNLQADASAASSALSSQLADVNTELRSLVPEPSSIPNVNLQSQLQSLSGLTNPLQSANLLADITSSFGDALTTSGFDLDSLVSSAAGVFGTDTSLSSLIPNFEVLPSGDVIQKASASLLPSIGPVTEEAATFVSNTNFTAAKTAAASAVYPTLEEGPTADTAVFTVVNETKKVTESSGGVSIESKGVPATTARAKNANYSDEGFLTKKNFGSEKINLSDLVSVGGSDELGIDVKLTLKHKPTKIRYVSGYMQDGEKYTNSRGFERTRRRFRIIPEGTSRRNSYGNDTFQVSIINSKEITINQFIRQYDRTTRKGKSSPAIYVAYYYNETYDPSYKIKGDS